MDVDQALDEEILNMSTDDIKLRCRLLDNECSYMKSGTKISSYHLKINMNSQSTSESHTKSRA
jgi:hypothetical protein